MRLYCLLQPGMDGNDTSASKLLSREKRNPSDSSLAAKEKVANPDNAATMQLFKTKMCSFHMAGRCGLANCKFAHGPRELKHAPNLKKTKLCFDFLQGCCSRGDACSFAHCNEDLRVTAGVYKTQMCHFFESGSCKKGDRCKHAHGARDLRRPSGTSLHCPSTEPRIQQSLPLADLLAEERPDAMSQVSKPVPTIPYSPVSSVVWPGMLAVQGHLVGTAPEPSSCSPPLDSQPPPQPYPLAPTSTQLWVPVPVPTQLQPQMQPQMQAQMQAQMQVEFEPQPHPQPQHHQELHADTAPKSVFRQIDEILARGQDQVRALRDEYQYSLCQSQFERI